MSFESSVTFHAEIDEGSLRDMRRTIESELPDPKFEAVAGGTQAPSEQLKQPLPGDMDSIARPVSSIDAIMDDVEDLAQERNELLRELIDETEENGRRGRFPRFGGGGGIGLLLAGATGAAGLGLAGLTKALEDFDVDIPDSIPVRGAPDEIDVDAPDEIPVDAPDGIPLVPPDPLDNPESPGDPTGPDTPPSPGGPPSPGPGDSPGDSPDPVPTVPADEIQERLPDDVPTFPGDSPAATAVPDDRSVPDSAYTLDPDYEGLGDPGGSEALANLPLSAEEAAVGGGVVGGAYLASKTSAGSLPFGRSTPAGVGTPAVPGVLSQSERGRGILSDILDNARSNVRGAGREPSAMPAASVSPFMAAAGGGGGSTGEKPRGNKSTTRRTETKVQMNIDARDTRNAREVAEKVRRKADELERRLSELERAGRRSGGL